jgi:LacI family transcriptional regulator
MSNAVPRLKDIAREANVSLSTASVILRDEQGRFSDETKERVLTAARQLGWRQNLLVQGMQTGKTRTVGVLAPPYDSFWTTVLSGVHRELAEADYMPITLWIGDHRESMDRAAKDGIGLEYLNRLLDRRVEALILWPPIAVTYSDHFAELAERNVPVVVIDHELPRDKGTDSVKTDERMGARLVAQHMLELGHRRFACMTETELPNRMWAMYRRKAFENEIATVKDTECRTWRLGRGNCNGVEVALAMLRNKPRPTAVFCVTDHEVVDTYAAAADLGLRIPQDLSVVGFSDLDFAATMRPALTTVHQNPEQIGRRAARLVLEKLDGQIKARKPQTVEVDCELIVRHSTQEIM